MGDLIKLLFSDRPIFGAILTGALAAGAIAFWRYEGYIAKSGADRTSLWISLQEGGGLRATYVALLTLFLDAIDRYFGDGPGGSAQTSSKPLGSRHWTGASFDRCAELAVMYPFLSLMIDWVIWGDAGPIGSLLGFSVSSLRSRAILMLDLIASLTLVLLFKKQLSKITSTVKAVAVASAAVVVVGAVCTVAVANSAAGTFSGSAIGAVVVAGAGAVVGTVVGSVSRTGSAAGSGAVAGVVATIAIITATGSGPFAVVTAIFAGGAIIFAASSMAAWAARRGRLGKFWAIFWPLAIVITALASRRPEQGNFKIFIIILSLIPLINIPFDWVSVNATRVLLRWGCRPSGLSPLLLGLLDLTLGLVLLMLLAVALVASLQLVDRLIVHSGGNPAGRVTDLLNRIDRDRLDPGNYWTYATLLSTLIPSAVNALIGAISVITWWPAPIRRWVVARIEEIDANPQDERAGTRRDVQAVLAIQVGIGACVVGFTFWSFAWLALEVPYVTKYFIGFLRTVADALSIHP